MCIQDTTKDIPSTKSAKGAKAAKSTKSTKKSVKAAPVAATPRIPVYDGTREFVKKMAEKHMESKTGLFQVSVKDAKQRQLF